MMDYLFYLYLLPLLICLAFFGQAIWLRGWCEGDLRDFVSYGLMPLINWMVAVALVMAAIMDGASRIERRLLRAKP